jgi:phage terminase large subunit GpA-like protein
MADTNMAIRAIPAELRGKETAIPAGYLHESKETAGIAGIETNPDTRGEKNLVCHMRLHALEKENAGCYPRFPRRVCVFKHLACGDRMGHPHQNFSGPENHRRRPRVKQWRKKPDFRMRGEAPAAEAIYGKREFYEQGVAPAGCLVLTMFVDVQQDRLKCELKGWGRDGQSWSVGAEVIAGDTSQQAVWDMLHSVVQQEWPHASGGKLPLWAVGIDSGYRPQKVYDFCARYAQPAYGPAGVKLCAVRTVVPTKGGHGWDRAIEGFSPVDAAKKRGGVRILTLGASYLKQAVYDALRLPVPPPGSEYSAGYWRFPDYEYSWFQGLTSESRIVRENGKPEWVHDKSVRNEPLDLAVGNLAMYILCRTRLDRCSNTDWRRLEDLTVGSQQDTPQPKPAPVRQERERWIEKRDWFSRRSDY